MFATINQESKIPKGISEIPFNTLAEDIRSTVFRYVTNYNLITSGNVKVSSDDWHLFVYVPNIEGLQYRIEIEL